MSASFNLKTQKIAKLVFNPLTDTFFNILYDKRQSKQTILLYSEAVGPSTKTKQGHTDFGIRQTRSQK